MTIYDLENCEEQTHKEMLYKALIRNKILA